MKINIQSPSLHPSDKLLDFANDKISKLAQYSDRIIEAQVTLKVNKADDRANKVCEIRLSIPGNDLYASRQCPSFEEAIMKTVEALRPQLLTWKEKTQNRNIENIEKYLPEN